MRFVITASKTNVTPATQEMVEKKLRKLEKYFDPDTEANVKLRLEKNVRIAEITIAEQGTVLRAEERSGDMTASVDSAVEKLEKQLLRHRKRLKRRLKGSVFTAISTPEEDDAAPETPVEVVRVKHFAVKPQDIEEAILQMDLLDHDFYVFRNAETQQVNVLYRRKDGKLGLIDPE